MAYEKPTPTEVIARFPEFEGADMEYIYALVEEAAHSVDQTWLETDYKPALIYLAAHWLALGVQQGGIETLKTQEQVASGVATDADIYVRAVSFGSRSISFGNKRGGLFGEGGMAQKATMMDFETTIYGQLFTMLLRRNSPLVLVV